MGKLNKSGGSGSGKNRKNAPSASEKANAGDADARKYASFKGVGGSVGGSLEGGKPTQGGV